ncbi:TetR/AcrR family transcriptional regulator [Streptomyces coeruleoprunus]|uniref:TetR/AcrR family transcriptional regulator n=1 Tax=Streptomyces coeruleoprunus TaxID=285563 RepID=A0ABV9XAD5_9ACTN
MASRTTGASRAALIADTALALLAERGMRGLTHRAVDEHAGLPQGSTSNHARTRQALLEAAVRRLADREAALLGPGGALPMPEAGPETDPGAGLETVADALALALHHYLQHHRDLLVARYELALEATRRPELRAYYDDAGRRFTEPLTALAEALGSPDPRRHALSLVAWCEGMLFACVVGSYHVTPPGPEELRRGTLELLRGMVDDRHVEQIRTPRAQG